MNAGDFGFKASDDVPYRRGRLVGTSNKQEPNKTEERSSTDEVLAAIKKLERFFKDPVPVRMYSNGVENLPFARAKTITMLEGIQLYLQAQLASVTAQLEKLKTEVSE